MNNIHSHKPEIEKLAQEYGLTYLALFGSQARGDNSPDSDIDILVDYGETMTFGKLIDLEERLTKLLGREVDVVTKKGVSKYLRKHIKPDLKVIYETA